MSFRLKGKKVIIEGDENIFKPKPLPSEPENGTFCVDQADGKAKVYNATKSRWIILGDAFDKYFLSESSTPVRNNGFLSTNVQEAIEEAKAAIEGKVSVLPTFLNNGQTKNKWLALDGAMESSNYLPAVTAFDSRLASITYVNDNDDTDIDLEFYKNGVLVYIWEVRNKRSAWKTNELSQITFTRGDRISCFAREVMDGTGVGPSSVIVFVNVQTVNSVQDEGGQQYGD